jgi:hypothetical protein
MKMKTSNDAVESNGAPTIKARLATIESLKKTVLPLFIDPVPCSATLRIWFDAARIPRIKTNPTAKRGGGLTFYSVTAVEKYFKTRIATS